VITDRIIGCPHEEGIDYEGLPRSAPMMKPEIAVLALSAFAAGMAFALLIVRL
jgi:hypothetical protein